MSRHRLLEQLTSDAREKLSGKVLNMTVGKRRKRVGLEEIKNALPQQIGNDTYSD